MAPKRKATAKKADKPEHEVKKQKLTKALKKCVEDECRLFAFSSRINLPVLVPDAIDVDEECPDQSLTVYIDHEGATAYDVMLNQVWIFGVLSKNWL